MKKSFFWTFYFIILIFFITPFILTTILDENSNLFYFYKFINHLIINPALFIFSSILFFKQNFLYSPLILSIFYLIFTPIFFDLTISNGLVVYLIFYILSSYLTLTILHFTSKYKNSKPILDEKTDFDDILNNIYKD